MFVYVCVMRRDLNTTNCSGAANFGCLYVQVPASGETRGIWGKLLDRPECLRPATGVFHIICSFLCAYFSG